MYAVLLALQVVHPRQRVTGRFHDRIKVGCHAEYVLAVLGVGKVVGW